MGCTGKPPGNRHHKMALTVLAPGTDRLRLPLMAEGSDTTLTAGIKSFAAGHGGAKAVIEYVGKRGARMALDGREGESSGSGGTANGPTSSPTALTWPGSPARSRASRWRTSGSAS